LTQSEPCFGVFATDLRDRIYSKIIHAPKFERIKEAFTIHELEDELTIK